MGCCDLVNYLIRRGGVRVVEGLNVITFGPKYNRVLNVLTFSPECNKPLMHRFTPSVHCCYGGHPH